MAADNLNKEINRVIGTYTSGHEGPLLFLSGSVHGNEPSGFLALHSVMDTLHQHKPNIKGTIVAITGNTAALKEGVRYIDEDLNRTWTRSNVASGEKDSSEKREMFEIIDFLNEQEASLNYTKRYFLDCHTTSAETPPFISVQEVNDNDDWAHHFPVYIIRGFSDIVSGCIDHYLSRSGITGYVFEAGQHDADSSLVNQEGIIWLVIAEAMELNFADIGGEPEMLQHFRKASKGQKTFSISYRHNLESGDEFKMEPGFRNFDKVTKGQLLAVHNGEEVKSQWDAYIHMPLYQSQGNDGFFIIEEEER